MGSMLDGAVSMQMTLPPGRLCAATEAPAVTTPSIALTTFLRAAAASVFLSSNSSATNTWAPQLVNSTLRAYVSWTAKWNEVWKVEVLLNSDFDIPSACNLLALPWRLLESYSL